MIPKSDWLKSLQRLKRKKNYFGIASLFYLNYTQSHLQSLTFPYIPLLNEHYVNGVLWTEIIYLMIASMLLTSCPSNQYFWGYLNVILCILKVVCILLAQEHPLLLSKLTRTSSQKHCKIFEVYHFRSKYPYYHSAYLVGVCKRMSMTVSTLCAVGNKVLKNCTLVISASS